MKQTKYQHVRDLYTRAIINTFTKDNLNPNQKNILSNVFFYEIIEKNNLIAMVDSNNFDKDLNDLIKNGFINENMIGNNKVYTLSTVAKTKLEPAQINLYEHNGKLLKTA